MLLPADHPRAREGLLIRQFDSCQGDGLLPLQEWQRPCRPTLTHCFCSGQVSERWIITDADACDAWLGLLHSTPKRKQAIPRCHHARAPHMMHPKYRGEKLTMEQHAAWNQGLGLVNCETSCQLCANNPEIKLSFKIFFVI